MNIDHRRTIAVSPVSGESLPVDQLLCPFCGSDHFHAFVIVGDTNPHLQCCECGETFCNHEGPCHLARPSQ